MEDRGPKVKLLLIDKLEANVSGLGEKESSHKRNIKGEELEERDDQNTTVLAQDENTENSFVIDKGKADMNNKLPPAQPNERDIQVNEMLENDHAEREQTIRTLQIVLNKSPDKSPKET